MSSPVTIKLGESGPDFAKRYPSMVNVAHQPAGLDFYSMRWAQAPHGVLILRAGWKPIILLSRPRLAGSARLDYVLNASDSIGLDPSVVPTLEEWMRIESRTAWHFYAPRAYLSVSFTRERTLTDPAKPGAYMLTFRLQTEAEHFRSYVESDDRPRWKALLPKILADLAKARQQKEAELRAKGFPIDETYMDPPPPGLSE